MSSFVTSVAKRIVKSAASKCGFQIERAGARGSNGYISAAQTIANADRAGLSVLDYVESLWDEKGLTQRQVDRITLACPNARAILEIGPGTGRYIDLLMRSYGDVSYELYETAPDWRDYLKRTFPTLTHHEADGSSLRQTADASIDLAQAHGVFVYLPFLTTCQYFIEMDRVTKPGSCIVFDVFTEACMDEPTITKWLASVHRYPAMVPALFIESFWGERGFRQVDRFLVKNGAGVAEYFIFIKMGSAPLRRQSAPEQTDQR
jgi:SAM-dependent methyltransferase